MADILIVVPTYDEIDNLERTVGRLRQSVPHAAVLVVDDASPDGTGVLADRLAADDQGIHVLHRTTRGYGTAVRDAFRFAIDGGYRFVGITDADGSFDSSLLPEMLAAAESGNDLVIGSRWVPDGDVRNMGVRRRVLSRAGNGYARQLLGTTVRDLTSGFRVYSTAILQRVPLAKVRSDAYAFQIEMVTRVAQAGGSIVEIPVEFTERALGASKMRTAEVLETLASVTRWGLRGIRARRR